MNYNKDEVMKMLKELPGFSLVAPSTQVALNTFVSAALDAAYKEGKEEAINRAKSIIEEYSCCVDCDSKMIKALEALK